MEVPEPRKLLPGRWHSQLRLGGESISAASASNQSCIQKAWAVKAEYLTGKRQEKLTPKTERQATTLKETIAACIEERNDDLSGSRLEDAGLIRNTGFRASWSAEQTTLRRSPHATGRALPKNLTMPGVIPAGRPFSSKRRRPRPS